jgi:hypothetical protein
MALSCINRVGRVGLEPTTYGLKVRYSAIELAPLGAKRSQLGRAMCTEYCGRGGWSVEGRSAAGLVGGMARVGVDGAATFTDGGWWRSRGFVRVGRVVWGRRSSPVGGVGAGRCNHFADRAACPVCSTSPQRTGVRRIPTLLEGSAPSSSGLGHRPFKAAARVRIPLGLRPATVGTAGPSVRPARARIAGLYKQGPVEQLGVLVTLSR